MENDVDLLEKYMKEFFVAAEDYGFAKGRVQETWVRFEEAKKNLETYVRSFVKHGKN